MKINFLKCMAIGLIILLFAACEKKLEVYNAGSGLNFYYPSPTDTLVNYSFIYGPPNATSDTLWLKVETIGPLENRDRQVDVEQIMSGANDAVPGQHYVSLTDPSVRKWHIVRAGKTLDSIPVILKRDLSLKSGTFKLWLRIKSNGDFSLTKPARSMVKINVTDQLSKPSNWGTYANGFFGKYGPVKHQFLINLTGEKWDDPYVYSLGFTPTGVNEFRDDLYSYYLQIYFSNKLAELNAQRIADGLGVLKEADNSVVSFARYTGP